MHAVLSLHRIGGDGSAFGLGINGLNGYNNGKQLSRMRAKLLGFAVLNPTYGDSNGRSKIARLFTIRRGKGISIVLIIHSVDPRLPLSGEGTSPLWAIDVSWGNRMAIAQDLLSGSSIAFAIHSVDRSLSGRLISH